MTDQAAMQKAIFATSPEEPNSPESKFARLKANAEGFDFNGLNEGETFRSVTHMCTRVELAAMQARTSPPAVREVPNRPESGGESEEIASDGHELEHGPSDSAEVWVVRLEYVGGASRTLHKGATMMDACRAALAIAAFFDLPVSVEATDFGCESEFVLALPTALRAELDRTTAFRKQHGHAAFALASMFELAIHELRTGERLKFAA